MLSGKHVNTPRFISVFCHSINTLQCRMLEEKPSVIKPNADLATDLEIIALQQPGKGAALRRCMDRAGLSYRSLADKLGYDTRSTTGESSIKHWTSERRWPTPDRIREILLACNIDRKVLLDTFGLSLGTEVTPLQESKQLLVTLRNELMFISDDFERRDVIFRHTAEKVLLFLSFKAFDDVKAATLFFDRLDKHAEERKRREQKSERIVSPAAREWNAGQGVYEARETPTGSALDDSESNNSDNPTQVIDSTDE